LESTSTQVAAVKQANRVVLKSNSPAVEHQDDIVSARDTSKKSNSRTVFQIEPCCSGDTDLTVIKEFQNLAPSIKICDRGSLFLLGSPIFDQGFKNTVKKTIITVENLLNKAELLSRHVA
jgi:hypothetical protein